MGLLKWLQGKKTYIIAITVGVLAALTNLGIVIPDFVYVILAALGLTTVSAAIKKSEPK